MEGIVQGRVSDLPKERVRGRELSLQLGNGRYWRRLVRGSRTCSPSSVRLRHWISRGAEGGYEGGGAGVEARVRVRRGRRWRRCMVGWGADIRWWG